MARIHGMVRLFCACLILVTSVVPLASASSEARVGLGAGLSVVVPTGWRLSMEPVTVCGNPTQRFVATTGHVKLHSALRIPRRSALVLLMEGSSGHFPARPARFSLPRHLDNLGGCCKMPTGPGAELLFRDRGRKFYAFVYVRERTPARTRRDIVRLLNSLKVSAQV
jgi:hypothetical protein